jgi:hypothetical protein
MLIAQSIFMQGELSHAQTDVDKAIAIAQIWKALAIENGDQRDRVIALLNQVVRPTPSPTPLNL